LGSGWPLRSYHYRTAVAPFNPGSWGPGGLPGADGSMPGASLDAPSTSRAAWTAELRSASRRMVA